jgi:hypothetical protein
LSILQSLGGKCPEQDILAQQLLFAGEKKICGKLRLAIKPNQFIRDAHGLHTAILEWSLKEKAHPNYFGRLGQPHHQGGIAGTPR